MGRHASSLSTLSGKLEQCDVTGTGNMLRKSLSLHFKSTVFFMYHGRKEFTVPSFEINCFYHGWYVQSFF